MLASYFCAYVTVESLFRDGNVNGNQLRYQEFINSVTQPVPDY